MKKFIRLIALLLALPFALLAQNRIIKGTVTDEKGLPLPGITVQQKGGKAIQTNADGAFSIDASGAGMINLVFTGIGFKSIIVSTDGKQPVLVKMQQDAVVLDEVVIGYQTVPRKDVTGSVSSISAKQLKDVPLTDAAQAITGRLAGVNVTTTEGAPGADIKIRVRGGGSITQDNSPIYIVDGIQVENALSTISPQDIASIDVLKDAATTAIYGARGANGVVIITTKSGKGGKTRVSYNGSVGFRELTKKMDVMNPYDFTVWQYERAFITGDTTPFFDSYGRGYDTLNVYKDYENLDWQEKLFGRKAMYQNHNVSVSGGSDNTTYNLSLTGNKEDGIMLESGFDRKLVNFKMEHKASDKLKIGFTARYLDQIIRGAGTTESGSRTLNRLRNAIQYRPLKLDVFSDELVFDEEYYAISNLSNPVILSSAEYRRRFTNAINLSGFLSYNILKNLNFRTTFGFDNNNRKDHAFNSKITSAARQYAGLPTASIGTQNLKTITNTNTLQYNLNDLGGHHDITILAGQEIYETRFENATVETRYFPAEISADKALSNMQLGSPPDPALQQPRPTSFIAPANRIFSLFGRVSYAYDDKYLVTASWRADRSSKFLYENGLLNFPSVSLAWRFTNEKFMENLSWLTDGKLRFGLGTAGNNRIGDFLYRQLYGVTGEYALNGIILPALAPKSLANPDLKWERNITRNLGLDLGFLNNRIQLTIDAYYNKTKDLLLELPIPPTTGYETQTKNVASTSNRGLELQLNATVVQNNKFSWTSNLNFAFNKNRVESLGPVESKTFNTGLLGRDGADEYILKVGESVGLMYGFVTDGFYTTDDFDYNPTTSTYTLKAGQPNTALIFGNPQPGTIKLKNLGGDSLIRVEDDRTVIGHAQPKFVGGWNNQFTYGNFDLSVFVNWIAGNDVFNANKIEWTDGSFANMNVLSIMNGRYRYVDDQGNRITDPVALTKLNENAKIWTPTRANRYYIHSWAIEDGSFLRINNITLGYSLPASLLKRVKMSQFRIYATVNNLATITGYTGYDPEIDTRRGNPLTPGTDMAGYPRTKIWVFGINASF